MCNKVVTIKGGMIGMRLNKDNFEKLTSKFSKTELLKMLNISRCQLWRIMSGGNVGTKVIANFKNAFPKEKIENYFF